MDDTESVLLQVESLFAKIGNLPPGIREEALQKVKSRLDCPYEQQSTCEINAERKDPPLANNDDEVVEIPHIKVEKDADDNYCMYQAPPPCENSDKEAQYSTESEVPVEGEILLLEGNSPLKLTHAPVPPKKAPSRQNVRKSKTSVLQRLIKQKRRPMATHEEEDNEEDATPSQNHDIGPPRDEHQYFKSSSDATRRKRKPPKTHSCDTCKRLFATPTALKVHQRVHTGERPFSCETCGRDFTQKSALEVHRQRHEGKPRFHCTECNYKCYMKIDLVRHMPKHTGERNFQCDICGNQFTTDSRLKDHIKHVHERKERFVCQVCGFVTHRNDNLRRHMDIKHTNKELIECPICHEVLKQRWNFIVHMRRHTGERPHKCHICGKSFKSPSQVAAHRRIHSEGMFQCQSCSRKFKTRDHLIRHEVVHTGLKPYGCPFCPYMCNVKGNINKHVKSVHKLSVITFREMKKQNTAAIRQNNPKTQEAVERGAQVAQEFLNKISIRRDENLSVDVLKEAFEEQERNYAEAEKLIPAADLPESIGRRKSRVGYKKPCAYDTMGEIEIHVEPTPMQVLQAPREMSAAYQDEEGDAGSIGVDSEDQTETIVLSHNVHYVCLQQDVATMGSPSLQIQPAQTTIEGDDGTVLVIECIDHTAQI